MKMILNISPFKSAYTAFVSALAGTTAEQIEQSLDIVKTNTAFQHTAWTIAIIAGIISTINGIIMLRGRYKDWKNKKHEKTTR